MARQHQRQLHPHRVHHTRAAIGLHTGADDQPAPFGRDPGLSGTCSGASIPATSPTYPSQNACNPPWPLAGPHHRGGRRLRLILCERRDADCNRLCTARRSDLASCDGAAGFNDRELFELALGPGTVRPLPVQLPGWPTTPSFWRSATPCWCSSRLTLSSWNSAACPRRSPASPPPSVGSGTGPIFPSGRSPARWSGFSPGGQSHRRP